MKHGDLSKDVHDRRADSQRRHRAPPRAAPGPDAPQGGGQDALTRAVIQIGSILRSGSDDQRLMAVVEAQRSVEELRDAFRGAMMVVRAAQRLHDTYRASLAAPDASAASRVLEDAECAEVALLVAVGRLAAPAPRPAQPQTWIDGAL